MLGTRTWCARTAPTPETESANVVGDATQRVQRRIEEKTVVAPYPQVVEETLGVLRNIPQERITERVVERIVVAPVEEVVNGSVEVAKLIPQERIEK